MTDAGCQWGQSWDLEVPLYFAPKGFEEMPSLRRSNAFDIVSQECQMVRGGVGLLDITGFSRFEVTGPNAERWLNTLMASKLPAPGRAALAPMLGKDGRMKGDLTLFNWGDGSWWIMGSYYLRAWHMRWFTDHLIEGVTVQDLGEEWAGFSLSGPKSREVIAQLGDGGADRLSFMGCGDVDIGLLRCKIGRLSVTGEMGYEIHCRMGDHIALRRLLLEAGAASDIREFGFNALLSLRLEKSFGIWSAEFTQGYTSAATGMDRWIAWDKPEFIGREAAIAERDGTGPAQKLVTLEIEAGDADASGFEPVWAGNKLAGFVTSGGYGHCVQRSLAMAMVDADLTAEGTELAVHVVGVKRAAKIIAASPYDPKGAVMRG
jgi:dimethylglycine dehydrogenase